MTTLPNVLYIDPSSIPVVDPKTIHRGSEPPHSLSTIRPIEKPFSAYHAEFIKLLGPTPSLKVVAQEKSYPFAHEAGVWIPSKREVFFTSNQFVPDGEKKKQIRISKLSLDKIDSDGFYEWENVSPFPTVITSNGATNYKGKILICSQGQDDIPGGLVLMDPDSYKTVTILNNYYGRPYNSPNDVVIYPLDGSIWFTDPHYGHAQDLRPVKKLPNQIYSFDPLIGSVRVVADGIHTPNGISFSYDNKTCYITDTQTYDGVGNNDDEGAATIYAFDIVRSYSDKPNRPYILVNKRVFAYADCGAPDGIKCDTNGNVYAGCQDGIHIWNSDGILIGKILVPGGVANFCFADPGTIFLFNENKIFEARLNATGALNTEL